MPTIQEYISQILPYTLAQPRSRADLLTEAERLYTPKYDELLGDTTGDITRGRADILRTQASIPFDQNYARGALKERLALMGLQHSGIGSDRTSELERTIGDQDYFAKRQLEDFNLTGERSLRGVRRDRAAAIEGYVTDPRFVFPYA